MVLKSDQRAAVPLRLNIADAAGRALAAVEGARGEDAYAGEFLSRTKLVGAAEQLIAAAHRQRRRAVCHRGPDRWPLGLEVLGDTLLFAVLPAAHEDQVKAAGIEGITDADLYHREGDAAGGAALSQRDDVPPVAVQIH